MPLYEVYPCIFRFSRYCYSNVKQDSRYAETTTAYTYLHIIATMRSKSCRGVSVWAWYGLVVGAYTNGLNKGEPQNGIREQLAAERGVAGNGLEEGGEDKTDTDSS